MAQEMVNVQIGEEVYQYEKGTTYREIALAHQQNYENDIVLVFVNKKLQELRKTLKADCEMQFVTTGDQIGYATYRRSMNLLLVKAIYDVCDHAPETKVRIHFSVSDGLYCTVEGAVVNAEFLDKVKVRMQEMIQRDIPINKRTVSTDDAVALFHQYGMEDKERLFAYRRVSKVNLYSINEFEDYFYGYMVPSTGYLKWFELYPYEAGFVIQMPIKQTPKVVRPFRPAEKLFHVQEESVHWGDMQNIETVGALNDVIVKDGPGE